MKRKKLGEELEVGDFVKLPGGDVGEVLEITKEGISVMNFNEEKRIYQSLFKKEKCDCCNKKVSRMDLFWDDSNKPTCKSCLNNDEKCKESKIDKIIDEFLESPYFNKLWEKQYERLRKKLKKEFEKK